MIICGFIEDVHWSEVFKGSSIYISKYIVFLFVILCVCSTILYAKILKILMKIVKIIVYSLLVFMIYKYIKENGEDLYLFTGFTFVFSVLEIMDNFSQIISLLFGENRFDKYSRIKYTKNSEMIFEKYFELSNKIKTALKNGKVSGKQIAELLNFKMFYEQNRNYFLLIKKVLNTDKDIISDNYYKIINSECYKKILDYKYYKGKHPRFTKDNILELKRILNETEDIYNQYHVNKEKIKDNNNLNEYFDDRRG